MKEKGLFAAFIIFLVMLGGDFYSTIINGELVKYLEANILYQYGGMWLILLVNLLVLGVLFVLYVKSDHPLLRFMLMNSLVMVSVMRVLAIYNNIMVYRNPPPVYLAQQVTTQMKIQTSLSFGLLGFLPTFIGIIAYLFWSIDHNIEKK